MSGQQRNDILLGQKCFRSRRKVHISCLHDLQHVNMQYWCNSQQKSPIDAWYEGECKGQKLLWKTLLPWNPDGCEFWGAAPHSCKGGCDTKWLGVPWLLISACAAQRSLLGPYWCFLSSLQDLSSAAGGESSPPLCFHWPQQEPTDESRVKLSKLRACHGIPDPYRNAFIVLKGWRHCLSKLEQTSLEKVAGTAAGTQFQSTVL